MKNLIKEKLKKILEYFLQGLLLAAPIGLTVYFIFNLFFWVDDLVQKNILLLLPFKVPGLGIVIFFTLVALLGFMGQFFIAKQFNLLIEKIISKAPLLETIYSSIKDFFSAFMGKDKKFNQPVLVTINKISNLEKMGFLTNNDLSELNIKDKVAVYFPHSYAFSGELFIVPSEDVKPLDITASEAMKFILSGGITKV